MLVYASHWEFVAARWVAGDYVLLQPLYPSWFGPLAMVQNLLKQKLAKKELELCDTPARTTVCSWPMMLILVCQGKYWRLTHTSLKGTRYARVATSCMLGVASGTGAAAGALWTGGGKAAADAAADGAEQT